MGGCLGPDKRSTLNDVRGHAQSRAVVSISGNEGWGRLLRSGDDSRGDQNCHRTRGTVRLAVSEHKRFAAKITDHQIQVVDANRPRILLSRTVTGNGYISAPHLFRK
jgi:hypothetical protein